MSPGVIPPAATLRLSPEALECIRNAAFEGLKALPRRGAEIGGFITAAASSPGVGSQVVPVRCEYLFGPSYHLSANDLPRLKEAAEESRKRGENVAAFFRSCTRAEDGVDAADESAIAEACPEVRFAVIARPSLSGSARIRIYRRGEDSRWTLGDETLAPPPVKETPTAPENARPVASPPAGAAPRKSVWLRSRPVSWIVAAALGLMAGSLLIGLWRAPRLRQTPSPKASAVAPARAPEVYTGLGLAVRPEGEQLHVTWNRESEAVRSAGGGALEIADGGAPAVITLRPGELTEGSLLYTPHSSDVTFRLRVRSGSGPDAEEMIREVGSVPVAENFETAPRSVVAPEPVFRREAAPMGPAPRAKPEPLPTPAAARESRASAPSIPARAVPDPTLVAPTPSPVVEPVRPAPVVAPVPTPTIASAPVLPSPVVVAPVPLRRVQPSTTALRSHVPEATTIGVLVSVDARGFVTDARTELENKGKSMLLQGISLDAARQWTFRPATVNGQPAPGKYRIQFVFTSR